MWFNLRSPREAVRCSRSEHARRAVKGFESEAGFGERRHLAEQVTLPRSLPIDSFGPSAVVTVPLCKNIGTIRGSADHAARV
jgi:hypothetical protein